MDVEKKVEDLDEKIERIVKKAINDAIKQYVDSADDTDTDDHDED